MNSYRDLVVWQKSIILVEKIYQTTKKLPKHEIYGITSQIQRAAVSIPSNIAEGYSRSHRLEYIQFLSIAKGSLAELETQILILKRVYPNLDYNEIELLLLEISKMLTKLIISLRSKP